MSMYVWIAIAVVVLVIAYAWYATIIQRRNKVQEALGSIDVQLRKRHDLVPNVLKLADQFMTHERELLSKVTDLRNQAQQTYDPKDGEQVRQHLEAEGSLQSGLRQLFAVAEDYPDLRSSETVIEAQQTFNEVEGHIAASRRFYNAAVTKLNNAVQIFPGSAIAGMVGVDAMPFFEIEEERVRQPVDVNDHLDTTGAADR